MKVLIGNLRNPQREKGNVGRPRYLNTIESEGNLPTQFGGKNEYKMSKASNNQLSQRSIHSSKSLKSKGSEEDFEEGSPFEVERVSEEEENNALYNNFVHSRINTDNMKNIEPDHAQ